MTFFITNKKQTEMLLVLLDYCDAIVIKRDQHKQKMDYDSNLMDCLKDLVGAEDSNCSYTS